jgi:hypothetical protein
MAAGSTYTPIATYTLASAASSQAFTSIPSTYTDLVLVMNLKGSTTNLYPVLQFNSDSTTTYSQTGLYGTGTAAGSQRTSGSNVIYITSGNVMSSTDFNFNAIVNVQNYSNTTTNKTMISRSNNAASEVNANVGLWRSTSAITRIDVLCYLTGNFAIGSTFTLYGIASA